MSQFFKNDFFLVLKFFSLWRLLLFLIAFASPILIPEFGGKFPYFNERLISTGLPHFLWSFANFDGVHYLGIAKVGYAYQFTQAFFPFYPFLIKLISPDNYLYLIIIGLAISNITFLVGLLVLYRLVKEKYSQNIAVWAIVFILAFPTSFYFGALYTEGLFLFLSVTSFYFAQKSNTFRASVLGMISSVTRLSGVFLLPALLLEKNIKNKFPLLLIPIGLIAYMTYLYLKFNNPFYFLSAQSIFGQGRSTTEIVLLPQVLFRYLKILLSTSGMPFTIALIEAIATVFGLAVLIIGYKKIPWPWLVFSLFAILTPTLTGTLTSMPRYVLSAFPIFVVLAQIESRAIKLSIAVIFALMLVILTTLFTQGYWVA